MTRRKRIAPYARGQRGIVLIIALVVLMIMSMAGVLMLRSLGSGLGIAGNVSFKEGATMAADRGVETARAWINVAANDKESTLLSERHGYFDTWSGGAATGAVEFNPLTYDWGDAGDASNPASVGLPSENGNTVQYVIHRMCEVTGSITAANQRCVTSESENSFGNQGSASAGVSKPRVPHYRITTRVTGPRNTISFVQVMLY